MTSKKGRLAVIPARGGSKRIPRKNIALLQGQPLLTYTVRAAIDSNLFDRIVVSTEDEEIADVAKLAGAEVPFMRAENLADAHTGVSEVALDTLLRLDPTLDDYPVISLLLPTCPLRTAQDIRESFAAFEQHKAEFQISIVRFSSHNPWWAVSLSEDHIIQPQFQGKIFERSQDLPTLYCPTGAIWWALSSSLLREKVFHNTLTKGWEINLKHGLDIDTPEDFALAEFYLQGLPA